MITAAGILAAVSAGLLLAGIMLINSDNAGHWLEERINSRLNGRLVIGKHRLSLAGQYLDINDLRLYSDESKPLIAIGQLRVELYLPALINRTLQINTMRIADLTADFSTGPDGSLNLASILTPAGRQPTDARPSDGNQAGLFMPRKVTAARVQINDSRITYTANGSPVGIRCPELSFSGEADRISRSGNLSLDGRELAVTAPDLTVTVDSLAVNAAMDHGRIVPLAVKADTSLGTLDMKGRIDQALTEPKADLSITGALHLEGLKRLIAFKQPLTGKAGIRAEITGVLSDPVIRADLACKEASVGPAKLSLNAAGTFKSGVIRLTRLSAQGENVEMISHGQYTPKTGAVSARVGLKSANIHNAAELAGLTDVSGRLEVTAGLSGTITDPAAELDMKMSGLEFSPINVDQVTGRAILSKGVLTVDGLTIQSRDSRARLTGAINLADRQTGKYAADPALNFRVTDGTLDLADFADDHIKGRAAISGHLNGSIRHPAGDLSLRAKGLDTDIIQAKQVDLALALSGDTIGITALDARLADDERLSGSGAVSLRDRTYKFNLASRGLSLSRIRPIQAKGFVDGTVGFSVSGNGDWWEIPFLDGNLSLDRLDVLGRTLKDTSVGVKFNGHLVDIAVQGEATASGTVDLADLSFSARGRLEETSLAPWFTLADRPDLDGRLAARLEAAGKLTDISAMTASAEIEQLVLSHDPQGEIRMRPLRLEYRDRALHIPDLALVAAGEDVINIQGKIYIDGTLSLSVNGGVPFAVPAMYIADIRDPAGRLDLKADVSGSLAAPVVTGEISLNGVGLSQPVLASRLHDINGRIYLETGVIRISDLQGGFGKGRFQVTGRAGLDGFAPKAMNVRFQAESLPIIIPDTMDLKLDADLALIMDRRQPVIRGKVVLLDGIYFQDAKISGYTDVILSSFEKKRALAPAAENRPPPFIEKTDLDVTVKHRLPLKVDNNIARLTVEPDIAVKGTVGNPVLLGEARTHSGEVQFQGTTFQVETGIISFNNPYKTEPHIDITAVTTVKQWRIHLVISGTPDQLEVTLTSDPYEEQGDILSLLVFGKTTRDMNAAAGASQSPAQILAGFLADKAAENIKHATGLDIVEISAQGNTDEENATGGRITVGSRLTDRLSFKYSIKSGKDGVVQENASEYRLTENVTVSGFQDNRGIFGGKLIYRIEFR